MRLRKMLIASPFRNCGQTAICFGPVNNNVAPSDDGQAATYRCNFNTLQLETRSEFRFVREKRLYTQGHDEGY
jgi:hypothetical protein